MSVIHQRTETAIRFRLLSYAIKAIQRGKTIEQVYIFYNIPISTLQQELQKYIAVPDQITNIIQYISSVRQNQDLSNLSSGILVGELCN